MNYRTIALSGGLSLCIALLPCRSAAQTNVEHRIDALLAEMTLEEKIGQMTQLSARDVQKTTAEIRTIQAGSILNAVDPATVNQLQRIAIEETRLGIPLIAGRDVIHGFKTIFPIPLGLGATFNPDIAEACARVSAREASAAGIRWTFAPMVDITQDPRWGRIAESPGEDPYLASVMGAAMVRGFQGDQLDDPTSIAACAKHLAGYGASEGGRDYNSTFIPERRLRNLYLRPFEAAADAGCATFMTSFSDNDGVPASGDPFLLKQVLRNEWNFDGFVVSDWGSISEMVTHGFCVDKKEAAMKAATAGVDMEMVSGTYEDHLVDLINEEKVPMAIIDNAVRNILRIKFRLGLFEHPYTDESRTGIFYSEDHLQMAQEAAEQSVVLLKNENDTLPLPGSVRTLAVIGPLADAPHEQLGTWVFDGEDSHTITPLAALKKQYGSRIRILYSPGVLYSRDRSTDNISKAAETARKADAIVVFVGEESILSGEAHCLANPILQGAQPQLIAALAATGKPLITVVMAGRPLLFTNEYEKSDSVLYAWHPGTMGGPAIARLLFGEAVPSAKLPVTFPAATGQIPIYYNHNNTGRPATGKEVRLNDIEIGAYQSSLGTRSYYLDAGYEPFLPFGYGLSYTTFEYGNPALSADKLKQGDTLKVSFELRNTGKYDATEVVQLYTHDIAASVTRPVKELRRFKRVLLKAGQSETVTLELPVEELAFWNIDMQKVVEPGTFDVWIGGNSRDLKHTTFEVVE